jgi:hypothetical protein
MKDELSDPCLLRLRKAALALPSEESGGSLLPVKTRRIPIVFQATPYIGRGLPNEEGRRIALVLLHQYPESLPAIVDLRGCLPGLMISGFFNGFLQQVHESAPTKLEQARQLQWRLDEHLSWCQCRISQWVRAFQPYPPSEHKGIKQ